MKKTSPKIRVFVSSTFLDMQKERDVLNQEVFPIVKGLCDTLGVPFNVIDLRWGITEEDQAKGNVIDLCLDEIQHCKPYFIGLIGNRYGWIPDQFDPDLEEKYRFIKENQDKSVTELEMILGALTEENRDRCFFYYKDESLFDATASDHKEDKIEALKQRINALNISHSDYASFDEFKKSVLRDLTNAIEKDYPKGSNLMEIKQQAYLNLAHRGISDACMPLVRPLTYSTPPTNTSKPWPSSQPTVSARPPCSTNSSIQGPMSTKSSSILRPTSPCSIFQRIIFTS